MGASREELDNKLNTFIKVKQWMNMNKLKVNIRKIKYMIIRSMRKKFRGNVVVKCIDGTVIEQVEKTKYLGVIIDTKHRLEDR